MKKNYSTASWFREWFPENRKFWVVFDLSNGNKGSKRYCWWFDSRKSALEHIQHQKKMRYGAELSVPHKVTISTE